MRTPKEVKRKIKDLRYRYLQKRYKKLLSRKPENCKYNFRQPLKGENTTIGLCISNNPKEKNEVEWQGTICDDSEDAKKCPRFICKFSKKGLAKILNEEIENEEVCREQYKDIYFLRWVLDEKATLFQRFINLFRSCPIQEVQETQENNEQENQDELP